LGDFDLLYRNIRNWKVKNINPPPFLYNILRISELLSYTHSGESFYKYGPDNYGNITPNEDILIFFSDTMKNKLINNVFWCVDGTFSVVPSPYYQLFTISYYRNHHVFPVILKNKHYNTYINLFSILENFEIRCNPRIIKVDYEKAAIEALKTKFPNTHISGCQFHLGQSINRKIKNLGLQSLYNMNYNIKMYTKALTALSYVRNDRVLDTFYDLKNQLSFPVELNELYDYFLINYISDNCIYPIELWNYNYYSEENVPRTTNAIEGWHKVFNSTFSSGNISLITLIKKLKNEEDIIRIKDIRMSLGHNFLRNSRYINMENNLNSNLILYNNENYGVCFVFRLVDVLFYSDNN